MASEQLIVSILLLFIAVILFFVFGLSGFALVRDNQVGILTKKMSGRKLPQGKIIATEGEIGIQADTLMPGLYWRFPIVWKISKVRVAEIPPGQIGVIESIDGRPIQSGRLLGDEVECNAFQDAKMFLTNGGRKGPQIGVLRPGTYRINLAMFKVTLKPAVEVPKEQVGIVIAMDGIALPSGFIVAPTPTADHKHFQDGQAFINSNGHRGPQLETLQPGEYYINRLLFEVDLSPVAVVPPGYVAVIVSSVGEELARPALAPQIDLTPDLNQPVPETVESLLITDRTQRGILKDPIAPGKYNLNTIAYRAELVPTSAITIDWASSKGPTETKIGAGVNEQRLMVSDQKVTEFFKFSQLRVTSKDGFQLDVDVRLIIRVPPGNAPFVIARFGTVSNLIEQVAHPLIDSSFRNEAGKEQALQFVQSRTELQEKALGKARIEFAKYHVEVQGLLIAYIDMDKQLLETQTRKEIAQQQRAQFEQEAAAQEQRIAVEEKKARADQQGSVITAKLSIDIENDKAEALRRQAEGVRDSTKTRADGFAYEAERVGQGQAAAYQAQATVLGQDNVAVIRLFQEIATGKIVITPEVLVTGGEGNGSFNIWNAYLSTLLKKRNVVLQTETNQETSTN